MVSLDANLTLLFRALLWGSLFPFAAGALSCSDGDDHRAHHQGTTAAFTEHATSPPEASRGPRTGALNPPSTRHIQTKGPLKRIPQRPKQIT